MIRNNFGFLLFQQRDAQTVNYGNSFSCQMALVRRACCSRRRRAERKRRPRVMERPRRVPRRYRAHRAVSVHNLNYLLLVILIMIIILRWSMLFAQNELCENKEFAYKLSIRNGETNIICMVDTGFRMKEHVN